MGGDYLAYSLLDIIVDNYFFALETMSDMVGKMEDDLFTNPSPELLVEINMLKKEMMILRK